MRCRSSKIILVVGFTLLAGFIPSARAEERETPKSAIGRQLIAKLGCPGCHTIADPSFSGLRKSGPDLRRIASKTNPGWILMWVTAPRELRPTSWMPHFLDDADPEEIQSMVAFLWKSSQQMDYPSAPAGDSVRGEDLFSTVGCTACHIRDADARRSDFPEPYRLQGPNLAHLGSKVEAAWLFAWLKNPKEYAPDTLMPDLRLSDREAADLTAFLMQSRASEREGAELPPANEEQLAAGRDAIELYGCYGCHTISGFEDAGKHAEEWASLDGFSGHGISGLPDFNLSARELDAMRAAVGSLSGEGNEALTEGRKLITQYNCRGCHLIEGWGGAIRDIIDDVGMLPPDLKSEGSRVQPVWLSAYVDNPTTTLRPWLTVRMPTFGLSEEEIRTIVTFFSTLEENEPASLPAEPPRARSIAVGRETFNLLQCGSCHPIGAEAAWPQDLETANLAPPLQIASRRLRYGWLPLLIKDPQRQLPGTKMPTFFFQSQPGVFESPLGERRDAAIFAEHKERLMEHFGSEEGLNSFFGDFDAMIEAMSDYIWSLGEKE